MQPSHWHAFCSRNAPQYAWHAKSCHFSDMNSENTARWRIVCAMSCHLSRISYECSRKCSHLMSRMFTSQCSRDTSWHLEKQFSNISNISHDTARTAAPDVSPRIASHTVTSSFIGTPNCVPWRKPFVVQCKGPFIATQLNSTRRRVELSCVAIDTFTDATQLSPTIGNATDPVAAYSQSARSRSVKLSWVASASL